MRIIAIFELSCNPGCQMDLRADRHIIHCTSKETPMEREFSMESTHVDCLYPCQTEASNEGYRMVSFRENSTKNS